MEIDHAIESHTADAAENVSELLPAGAVPADRLNARRKRIAEFEDLGLCKVEPLDALIDGASADLFSFTLDIGAVVKQIFKQNAPNADVVEMAEPVLDLYLKVTHQIADLLKAKARLSAPAKDTGNSQLLVQLLELKGSLSDGTSEDAGEVLITGGAEPAAAAMEVGR
jgi:hypothetical protein